MYDTTHRLRESVRFGTVQGNVSDRNLAVFGFATCFVVDVLGQTVDVVLDVPEAA